MSPHAERCQKRKRCGASSRPAMPQPAGASPARSSPASRRASKAATYASSSPTCQAGQKSSTKRSIAHAGAIDLFVEDYCPAWQVGDDEAYVAALLARLDAGDDLAGLAPAGCGIAGLEEAPHLLRF